MRYVPLERLKAGMQVAQDLYSIQDGLILKQKATLTEEILKKLTEKGLNGLYIDDSLTSDIKIWGILSPLVRYKTMCALKNKDWNTVDKTVDKIADELEQEDDYLLNYIEPKLMADYPYAHNINMAVVSCAISKNMNKGGRFIHDLISAALYCDTGMSKLDEALQNKTERLNKNEYQKMKQHPRYSYEMVRTWGGMKEETKQAILHHHENEDGSGYPDGMMEEEIPEMAKILHVADVFDAMISKRPFKQPYTQNEAMEYLFGGCGTLFDTKVVKALSESVPRYQRGTDVVLPGGILAVVYKNFKEQAPIVKTSERKLVDLSDDEHRLLAVKLRDQADVSKIFASERARNDMVRSDQKSRIMIVDDQAANLQVLREMLEEEYDLVLLKSGEQALKFMERGKKLDLILMDINMPGMDGIETTREINKKTHNTVPVLFVSANHERNTILACKKVGCAGFVLRPYNEFYIRKEIDRIILGEEA